MNKQTPVYLMLTLIASIASIPLAGSMTLPEAEAQTSISLSGSVKNSSGTGIAGATVYIEGYKTTLPYSNWKAVSTDSSGNWSTTIASGYTYTVMASKYGYSRAHHGNQITSSTSGINLTIDSQSTAELGIYVVGDDEFRNTYGGSWAATAWNKIVNKESSLFKANYNIMFSLKGNSGTAWNSPGGETDCSNLLADAISDTSWNSNHYGSDVLVAITDQPATMYEGGQAVSGCADRPGSGGQYPTSLTNDNSADVSGTIAHEILHNYGHVSGSPDGHHSTYYACTMSTGPAPKDYDQMAPSLDSTMAIGGSAHRTWY